MENGKPVTKVELDAAVGDLRGEIRAQKDELVDAMRQIETNLLTEFHRYAKGQNARVHNVEVSKAACRPRPFNAYPNTGSAPSSHTPSEVSPPMRISSMRLAARGVDSVTFR